VDRFLVGLISNGHILLEGVPGLAKTLALKTLSSAIGLHFQRMQFTPDMLPADIVGTMIYNPREGTFSTKHGPVFANLILADEINRAPAKVQSALLEAMQERQVTLGDETYRLPDPFLVMATQNPLEQEGTYPLPEAQLDRFFFKLIVGYPNAAELTEVLTRTTEGNKAQVNRVTTKEQLLDLQTLVRQVPVASHVKDYAVRLVLATHPKTETAVPISNQYLRFGSSPRGGQVLLLAGKVRALMHGRYNVSFEDIQAVASAALRHRLILNFEAEAEGITTDHIIDRVLKEVPRDAAAAVPA
jgi:MoxR-like ATPase